MLFSGLRKQSDTIYPLYFMLISSVDHITGLTGKAGNVVVTISKGTGGFNAPAGAINEVGNGIYYVAGNATDSNTLGPLFLHAKDAASDPYDSKYDIVNYDPFTFKPPVTLEAADVFGNLPAQVKGQDNIDFGALQKASITSAVPTASNIAISVEQHIINEADGEQVLKAITDKIAAVDPSLGDLTLSAIASAVRTELTIELGRIDAAITSRLAASGYTVPPSVVAIRTEMDSNSTKLAHLDVDISSRTKPVDAQTIAPPVDMALNSTVAKSETALDKTVWTDVKAGYIDKAISETGGGDATLEKQNEILVALGNLGAGNGNIAHPFIVTDTDGPVEGAEVWATTDEAGTNRIESGFTDSNGLYTFHLASGDYWFWAKSSKDYTSSVRETVA
jgi:hypothetical protein